MGFPKEVYVSAVSSELRSAREAVASRLRRLGYRPVWLEFTGATAEDLRPSIALRVRRCKAVIQLIGDRYGWEPPLTQQVGGRTSYVQYEALCARAADHPVWHFVIGEAFPRDASPKESDELAQLQATYRRRAESFASAITTVATLDDLRHAIDRLKGDLVQLRRRSLLRQLAGFFRRLKPGVVPESDLA